MGVLGEYSTAQKMRDTIRTIVRRELVEQRPTQRFATVDSVNPVTGVAGVIYTGENDPTPVPYGAITPVVGARVVVDGPTDARRIVDRFGDVPYQLASQRGQANGYAPLGADGLVPDVHLPPGSGWTLIEKKVMTAVPSNVIGNVQFSNIPTEFTRLRLYSPWMSHSNTSASHLYMRFNEVASAYGLWLGYHTTSSWTGTTGANQANSYAIYNYFYGGASRDSSFECDIWQAPGQRTFARSRGYTSLALGGAPYGSDVETVWNNTAQVSTIDLWTSAAANWSVDSTFILMGSAE